MPRTWTSVAALALAALLPACAATGPHPTEPPPAGDIAEPVAWPKPTILPSGVRVLRVPGSPDSVRAALVMARGPIDEARGEEGLTDLTLRAALLGTEGDPSSEARPERRALNLGGAIFPVSSGSLSGWALYGPPEQAGPLLDLLLDTAMAPTFPATRVQHAAELMRESQEARGDETFMRAIGLGIGVAVGHGRGMRIDYDREALARFNRQDVLTHWERLMQPERLVLVVSGGESLDDALAKAQRRLGRLTSKADPPGPRRACTPSARSSHLVVKSGAGHERVFTMLVVRAPGLGEPGREALEVALAALATEPTGRVARELGIERATDAAPRLIDLGRAGGKGAAVLVMRAFGETRGALMDLWKLIKMLDGFRETPPKEFELGMARRQAAADRLARSAHPVAGLLVAASDLLYGRDVREASTASLGALFPKDSAVILGVGPPPLGAVLERLAPLTVWNEESERIGGKAPPKCRAEGI